MKIKVSCDGCGIEMDASNSNSDYDGSDYCGKCWKEKKVSELKGRRDRLQISIDADIEKMNNLNKAIASLEAEDALQQQLISSFFTAHGL